MNWPKMTKKTFDPKKIILTVGDVEIRPTSLEILCNHVTDYLLFKEVGRTHDEATLSITSIGKSKFCPECGEKL